LKIQLGITNFSKNIFKISSRFFYNVNQLNLMEKVCFSCKQAFALGSLKTSRTRFKLMGITPPEGMSISDKICNKCLHEMYDKQIKHASVKNLKRNMANDLLTHKKEKMSSLPKKIGLEKKKRVFQ
jgi:hypothetical protein